jgi:hypothetical protein
LEPVLERVLTGWSRRKGPAHEARGGDMYIGIGTLAIIILVILLIIFVF